MIGYLTIGTNDLARAATFYDPIAKELGAGRVMESDRYIGWGAKGSPALLAIKPFNGQPATVGNGDMTALAAKDRAQVDRVHALALSLGGKDEGAPGLRGGSFYGAYFRDLDGNKLAVFFSG